MLDHLAKEELRKLFPGHQEWVKLYFQKLNKDAKCAILSGTISITEISENILVLSKLHFCFLEYSFLGIPLSVTGTTRERTIRTDASLSSYELRVG